MRERSAEFSSDGFFQFNHPAFVAPSTAAAAELSLPPLPVLWIRGKVGGRSSIDALLGSFQHRESNSEAVSTFCLPWQN